MAPPSLTPSTDAGCLSSFSAANRTSPVRWCAKSDVQPSRDLAFYVSSAHWLDAAKHPVDEQFDELLAAIQDWQKTTPSGEQGTAIPPPLPIPTSTPEPARSQRQSFRWLPLLI